MILLTWRTLLLLCTSLLLLSPLIPKLAVMTASIIPYVVGTSVIGIIIGGSFVWFGMLALLLMAMRAKVSGE